MSMQKQVHRRTVEDIKIDCPAVLDIRHRPKPIPEDLFVRLWRISPTWAWRLRHCDVLQFRSHLTDPRICIVGEAHKWNADYMFHKVCQECKDLGNLGIWGAFGYHEALEAFCDHWEEAHAK